MAHGSEHGMGLESDRGTNLYSINDRNEIVGIVSMGDLATSGNQEGKVGQAVENISAAPPNN